MSLITIISTILSYFAIMIIVALMSARKSTNADFFVGGRKSNWIVVTIAMISACMSGVTFVSVPGMVGISNLGYLQMCLGFIVGYFVIAFILVPIFYKLNVISIYEYLEQRFGVTTYKTGAWFFFISKILGASIRLFLVCISLQILIFDPLNLPFYLNVIISITITLAYTYKGGVKSVIWTDNLKTFTMIASVVLCIIYICKGLNINFWGLIQTIQNSEMTKIFEFNDINSPQYFWKQFFGGMLIVIATTGLDQDIMQRTLSCKNYKDSQKNLITSTFLQTIVIIMFLCLGILLYVYAKQFNIQASGDKLFPCVATSAQLPLIVGIMFIIGLISCSYGAAGSSLTSLTTSFTLDIIGAKNKNEQQITHKRKFIHICMAILMGGIIIIFNQINQTSAIDAVYKIASYSYGPILGLFAFGIITKKQIKEKYVPFVALCSICFCYILQSNSMLWFSGYQFSYELLFFNALFTYLGLCLLTKKN